MAPVKGPEIVDDLAARGLVQDHTDLDALRSRLASPITLYAGNINTINGDGLSQ